MLSPVRDAGGGQGAEVGHDGSVACDAITYSMRGVVGTPGGKPMARSLPPLLVYTMSGPRPFREHHTVAENACARTDALVALTLALTSLEPTNCFHSRVVK